MGEKEAFTCQNPSCRKSFTTPLKTVNLQQDPQETYYACPYCLTKIIVEESPKADQEPQEKAESKRKPEETKQKLKSIDKPAACNHHPGYLSERPSNEQIPDECLVCKDIVDCMLKKMRE